MEAVCYRIPLSRPNLCGTNSCAVEDITSLPGGRGTAWRSGYDPKRRPGVTLACEAAQCSLKRHLSYRLLSNPYAVRAIGTFFFWTNSRKPLYTLNKMNVRQVTATARGACGFGDSD
jgi:hypothetical protein